MKMIAIGGGPGCGKTTLMLNIMSHFGSWEPFKFGKVRGQKYVNEKVLVLGIYEGDRVFQGTDRLSMSCQPDAVQMLEEPSLQGYTILFEGDRLFNGSFLLAANDSCDRLDALLLTTAEEELNRRHQARGDTQTEQFKRSRATKYKNIAESLPFVMKWANESVDDREAVKNYILETLHLKAPEMGVPGEV